VTVERVRVGDVLSLRRHMLNIELEKEYQEIGVRSFGRGIFHKAPVSGADLGSKRVFRIEPRDLVLSNVFAWEGAIAVASDAESGKIGSHRFMTFVPADDRINTSWASWFFRSKQGLELIRQASPGSAGRNRTLAIDRFEALEIPLPPIDEQRSVAERLDRLEASTSTLGQLSLQAARLINALSTSVVTRPDLNGVAKARLGWRRVTVGDVLTLNNRVVTVEIGGSYHIAGVYSFGRGMFRRTTVDGTQTSYKEFYQLRADQIVMSRLKAWEGAIALVPSELENYFVSPEFPTFDIDSGIAEPRFLSAVLASDYFWRRLKGVSKGIGARRERVDALRLLQEEIDMPPLDAQRSIAGMVEHLHSMRLCREEGSARLSALVPSALAEVFESAADHPLQSAAQAP
jgi:type I restriction enzyme, S subunit